MSGSVAEVTDDGAGEGTRTPFLGSPHGLSKTAR
jgi:hypothetical protein